jgi:hypothetical protein
MAFRGGFRAGSGVAEARGNRAGTTPERLRKDGWEGALPQQRTGHERRFAALEAR